MFDSCWRKTVVCCKDLSTGLVLMTVDTWYPLAQSFKLFHISVRGQGKFATEKPYLAEHIDHAVFCSAERPHTATNTLCNWCHHETEGQRCFLGWVRRVVGILWAAVGIQSSLGMSRIMFYQFCLWILTHCQRHLITWVNSEWFWKMCALIQIMKWPPEESRTTDGKTKYTLTHLPIPQVTLGQLDLFDVGFLFYFCVIFSFLIPLIQVSDGLVCYKNL